MHHKLILFPNISTDKENPILINEIALISLKVGMLYCRGGQVDEFYIHNKSEPIKEFTFFGPPPPGISGKFHLVQSGKYFYAFLIPNVIQSIFLAVN